MTRGVVTKIVRKPDESKGKTDKELRADPVLRKDYGHLFDRYPDHPVVMDDKVLRWKRDPLIRWIADRIDLNKLWMDSHLLPMDSIKKFYRDMGYSLCGYEEVFEDESQ